jgi:hypothetical protein
MNCELDNSSSVFTQSPDLSSGSNDVYFRGNEVIKILKPSAALYQFCVNSSPLEVLELLEKVKYLMINVFGDMIVQTRYSIQQERIITTQPKILGKTLEELGRIPSMQLPDLKKLNQGVEQLRLVWNEDRELLGFIVDEITNPSNVLFDGEKLIIIDWL